MLLSAEGNGCLCTPKGNGIKDGFVRWVCVYAVVFWMPRFPGTILHVYFIFLNGLWQLKFTVAVSQVIVIYGSVLMPIDMLYKSDYIFLFH